jgi:hypothetical protein
MNFRGVSYKRDATDESKNIEVEAHQGHLNSNYKAQVF